MQRIPKIEVPAGKVVYTAAPSVSRSFTVSAP